MGTVAIIVWAATGTGAALLAFLHLDRKLNRVLALLGQSARKGDKSNGDNG